MMGRHGKPWLPATRPCFFHDADQDRQSRGLKDYDKEAGEEDELLYCRQCRAPLTSKRERLSVLGKHCHALPNPEGIVFEIGCFGGAPGCLRQGDAMAQYSWFPPHAWSYALCRSCKTHVGWYYEAPGKPSFYGLILTRLLEGGN